MNIEQIFFNLILFSYCLYTQYRLVKIEQNIISTLEHCENILEHCREVVGADDERE